MPRRKICPNHNCGAVNDPDSSSCAYCGADLQLQRTINIPKSEIKTYFNYETNTFTDEAPKAVEEPVVEPETVEVEKPTEEKVETKKLVKICPTCMHENDASERACIYCGHGLSRVEATEKVVEETKTEEIKVEPEKEPVEEPEKDVLERTNYVVIFGKNDDNTYPVNLKNHVFPIGRMHQSCLKSEKRVSRHHCFIIEKDDKLYLFETSQRPSTHHTFMTTVGDNKIKIEPGKLYELKDGDTFYLADVPVLFLKQK